MKKEYKYYVYIATNKNNTILYTGVSNNIYRRSDEHTNKINKTAFTAKYNINKIVYYEIHQYIDRALEREKQIKAGSRRKKIDLINSINPDWHDLIEESLS